MWGVNEGGMKTFDTLDSSEKRWMYWERDSGHRRRIRKGMKCVKDSV